MFLIGLRRRGWDSDNQMLMSRIIAFQVT